MGNFYCALGILAFIIIFTAVNSFIICNICDDITEMIDKGDIENACKLWQEKEKYILLFVRDAEIDVVNSAVKQIGDGTSIEDGEAETAYMRLREAIAEVRHSESAAWSSIF